MDNSEILKDLRRLPVAAILKKHDITYRELREINGKPVSRYRVPTTFPRRKPIKKASRKELEFYVERYNREHGTDWKPLI